MANLIVHIGGPKCGSSGLQATLVHNRQALHQRGFFIPDKMLGQTGECEGHQIWAIEDLRDNPQELVSRVTKLSTVPAANVIISAENICNYHQMPRFFAEASKAYQTTKIVFYIRRQDDFFISAWQQWGVKSNLPFHQWLNDKVGKFANWYKICSVWLDNFKSSQFVVRPYHTLKDNDAGADFLNVIGCPPPGIKTYRINQSFNDAVVSLAETNGVFKNRHDNEFYDWIHRRLGDSVLRQGKSSLLTIGQRRTIYETYAPGNEEIRRVFFPDWPVLFPEPVPHDVGELSPIQRVQQQNRMIIKLLFEMTRSNNE